MNTSNKGQIRQDRDRQHISGMSRDGPKTDRTWKARDRLGTVRDPPVKARDKEGMTRDKWHTWTFVYSFI